MSLGRTLLVAVLIVGAAYAGTRLWRGQDRPDDALVRAECWFPKPALRTAECYRFSVPESRGTASNRTVRFPVVILRSPSTPAEEPPVLHLMGGPGQPAGIAAAADITAWGRVLDRADWARDRDHILVDTRGIGPLASPQLRCAMLSDIRLALTLDRLENDPAARDAAIERTVGACRDALLKAGVDLAAYDTAATAQDLIALRAALGLPRWTVYGISYGSRLALELMRRDAAGIHAAILDSLVPPNVPALADEPANLQRALTLLYADCEADTSCAGAYPFLQRDLERTILAFRARPMTLTLTDPDRKSRQLTVTVDDGLYLQVIEYGLMVGDWLPFLPGIINDTARGGTVLFSHLAARLMFDAYMDGDANALLLSALCREELPFNDPQAFARARDTHPLLRHFDLEAPVRAQCAAWPAGVAPKEFREPVKSSAPTLLINGAYGTRTPPTYAERQLAHMNTAFRVVLRSRGHAPSTTSACAQAAMAAFLDSPRQPEPPTCLRFQRPPHFMTRGGEGDRIRRL